MISIVTTSTISSITLAGSFAIIGILVLLVLLIQKEMTSSISNKRTQRLSRALNIGIIPLIIAFALIVVARVATILH